MGVLIEIVKHPNRNERFVVCKNHNVYSGLDSVHTVPLQKACEQVGGNWTGKVSMEFAQKIFDDIMAAANSGAYDEYYKSIRVTKYHKNAQGEVYLPRAVEQVAAEPAVLPVAQATDGAWRLVPTTGFAKRLRGWEYQGAFVDSSNEGRTILVVGDTQLECVMRLFGSLNPVTQEFVRTFPFADPKDIPTQAVRALGDEDEYVPTQAELDAVPALEIAYCDSLSAAEMKRLNLFDWKFREGYRKRMILDAQADRERAEIFKREKEAEDRKAERKRMLADDADKKRKGDL